MAVQLNYIESGNREIVMEPLLLDIWAVDKFFEYNSHRDIIVPNLDIGDEVWLKKETQGYSHVLLYIGNGEVVHVSDVEKTGLRLGKTIVAKDRLDDVGKNKLIGVRKTTGLNNDLRDEIVIRALRDVGKYFPYLLTTDNCEHQVKYWISGVKDYRWIVSTQVRDHVVIGLIGLVIGMSIGAGLTIFLWSTEIYAIVTGTVGGGLIGAVGLVAFKYIATSIEHRNFLRN